MEPLNKEPVPGQSNLNGDFDEDEDPLADVEEEKNGKLEPPIAPELKQMFNNSKLGSQRTITINFGRMEEGKDSDQLPVMAGWVQKKSPSFFAGW